MRSWHTLLFAPVLLAAGCFNPSDSSIDTDGSTDGTDSSTTSGTMSTTQTTTSATESTTTDPSSSTTMDPTEGTGTTGSDVPDWGEGEPPDFGDLGPEGDGAVLVVHALDTSEPVDVWLVGESEPAATDLAAGEAIRLEGIARDARRVVLANAGTTDAVACSDWFPLQADDQWAVVSARESHTCPNPVAGGASITFEQSLPLSGNPLRFVHAGVPDDIQVLRGATPEAGTLSGLGVLSGSDLPDCSGSGCQVPYTLQNNGLGFARDFTFQALEVADVPPAGEVLLVVLGDLRQDWPAEPDALRMLRVDIDGDASPVGRDPELAVVNLDSTADVVFSYPAPPALFDFATVPPCGFGETCAIAVEQFAPGTWDITATGGAGGDSNSYELAAGHRYVLAFTEGNGTGVLFWEDAFEHSDDLVSTGRGFGIQADGNTLTLGRIFGGMGQPFDSFVDMPRLTVSDEQDLPTGSWDLVSGANGGALSVGCFRPVSTDAGWRGLMTDRFFINLTAWPPQLENLPELCA